MTDSSLPLSNSSSHVGWIDLLRVVACVAVVLAHNCDAFVGQFLVDPVSFYTGTAIGSLMRPSVPLFVMITAVLLLPVRSTITLPSFYRRRVGRIVVPLIFWSIALPLLTWLYFAVFSPGTQNPIVDLSSYNSSSVWHRIATFIFNFNFDTTPLWYLYMLVGLYLIMPVISTWLEKASPAEIRTLLWVWLISLFLPYVEKVAPLLGYVGNYGNMGILGVCDWNPYGTFYYLSGFVGYAVLAYYLRTYPLRWSSARLAAVCIPSFLIGYAITFLGFVEINTSYPGDYSMLEIIWYFCSINVVMMTVPVFILFSRLHFSAPSWLSSLAGLTFGIYLCHFVFVFFAYDLLASTGWPYWIRIFGGCTVSFACAAALTWIFSIWRPTRRLVG